MRGKGREGTHLVMLPLSTLRDLRKEQAAKTVEGEGRERATRRDSHMEGEDGNGGKEDRGHVGEQKLCEWIRVTADGDREVMVVPAKKTTRKEDGGR
jgi:hypothetical protein